MNNHEKLPPDLNDIDRRLRKARPAADQPTLDRIKAKTLGGPRNARNAGARRGGLALVLTAGTMLATTGAALGLGGFFVTGKLASLTGHGKHHAAHHALLVGAGAPSSVNRSGFAPSGGQGAGNSNANAAPSLTTTGGDTFLIGTTYTSNNQAINNSQTAVQGGIGGGGGTTIINRSTYAPVLNQSACNVNSNGNGATGAVYCGPSFLR